MRRMLARYPLLTLRLTARIYTHAARLKLRGAPYHPHPDRDAKGEKDAGVVST